MLSACVRAQTFHRSESEPSLSSIETNHDRTIPKPGKLRVYREAHPSFYLILTGHLECNPKVGARGNCTDAGQPSISPRHYPLHTSAVILDVSKVRRAPLQKVTRPRIYCETLYLRTFHGVFQRIYTRHHYVSSIREISEGIKWSHPFIMLTMPCITTA